MRLWLVAFDSKRPLPVLPADVRETQEVERLGKGAPKD